jgi:hypothetical protein
MLSQIDGLLLPISYSRSMGLVCRNAANNLIPLFESSQIEGRGALSSVHLSPRAGADAGAAQGHGEGLDGRDARGSGFLSLL